MKNKEKEIEEMSRDLCHSRTCDIKKNGGNCYKYCNAYIYAFRSVNAGYRKQREGEWVQAKQEVAREIFEEIEDVLNNIGYFDEIDFRSIKNKYLGEDINATTKESEGEG